MKRHLVLRRERLAELPTEDLAFVGGAATTNCFTGYYPSINAPCTTLLRPVTSIIDLSDAGTCA